MTKTFDQLVPGDVIIDIQGARHTITEIGGWEHMDDIWDEELGDVISGQGRRIYTDTYPKGGIVSGQSYTAAEIAAARFNIGQEAS